MLVEAAEKPAPGRSPRPAAAVAAGGGSSLEEALADALLRVALEGVVAGTDGRGAARGRGLIKPLLPPGVHPGDTAAYVDPSLVASLIRWLGDHGWSDVAVAVGGPDGVRTARAVGYDGAVVDLLEECDLVQFGGPLGEHEVSRAWTQADLRIVVGKARTDTQLFYGGAMIGVLGAVPQSRELARRIATSHEVAVCVSDVLERLPVAAGVIDVSPATAGSAEDRRGARVLVSPDLLALDWVLGELMSLDGPELNPVIREALHRRGPLELDRRGDLSELEPWRNVSAARVALSDLGAGHRWAALVGSQGVPWTDR